MYRQLCLVRFVNELDEPTKCLLTAITEQGDAETLTDTIIEELTKARLNSGKIISQVYDGASLMSG